MITRKQFLLNNLRLLGGLSVMPMLSLTGISAAFGSEKAETTSSPPIREARHYKKIEKCKIKCELCPRECVVGNMERGYCGARENQDGKYYTLVYGNPCAVHVDPIEKKPLFHYLPGTFAYSLSTAGCNLNCRFCQNWEISQSRPENVESVTLLPRDVVAEARGSNSRTIVGTYAEPIIFFEYMSDLAREARKGGMKSAIVSAGYIKKKPLQELCKLVDAIKIDLKAFDDDFYKRICVGELKPILETLKIIKEQGVWLEIVYLVIPTLNDSISKIKEMCEWIKKNLGCDVPVHFTRFHPMYKLKNLPATPVTTLKNIHKTAKSAGLNYVYIGNVPGDELENTYCPRCKKLLIKRTGFVVRNNDIQKGKCKFCQNIIPGIWG